MSRLDQHLVAVQNRLALRTFIATLAWLLLGLGVAAEAAVLVEKLLDRNPPRQWLFLLGGAVLVVLAAGVRAIFKRPSQKVVAIAIDRELGLKEKYSSALYLRRSADPFAAAAVRDAERSAMSVSLNGRFRQSYPPVMTVVLVVFLALVLSRLFIPSWTHTRITNKPKPPSVTVAEIQRDQQIRDVLPKVQTAVKTPAVAAAIEKARVDLPNLTRGTASPQDQRTALAELQALRDKLSEEMKSNEDFISVQAGDQLLRNMGDPRDESTPMGKAQEEIKQGDFDKAAKAVEQAIKDFNSSKPEDQQKIAQQAQQLAQALQQAATNPQAQQQIANQLQQTGMSQQQAQQVAQQMQQAAQGNPQAQQQVQQAMQQVAQAMNGGQGATPQQQKQIGQMMAKIQAQMKAQQQVGALAGTAQQVASAMQQGQSPANGQKQGQQPGQQGGNQPGGQGQQQQQVAAAGQQMQQQLQNMQAQSQNAQAIQNAKNLADAQANDVANQLSQDGQDQNGQDQGGNGDQNNSNNQPGGGNGQFAHGNPNQQGNGQGGPGIGKGGGNIGVEAAPYATKTERDLGIADTAGKLLLSQAEKGKIDPGKAQAMLRDAELSDKQDQQDEVDNDRIPRQAAESIKQYFGQDHDPSDK